MGSIYRRAKEVVARVDEEDVHLNTVMDALSALNDLWPPSPPSFCGPNGFLLYLPGAPVLEKCLDHTRTFTGKAHYYTLWWTTDKLDLSCFDLEVTKFEGDCIKSRYR
jgi:hypothetical protein